MKIQGIEIIKDIVISVLIIACIIIILSVIFYDETSLSKVIPQSEEYLLTDEMQQELEATNLDEAEEVVVNYYIDAADLRRYENTNEYDKGKSNPFAVASTSVTGNNTDNTSSDDNTLSSTNNTDNSSENFYEDDGTK